MLLKSKLIQLNFAAVFRNIYGLIRGKFVSLLWGVVGIGVLGQILAFFSIQSRILMFGVDTILVNMVGKRRRDNEAYLGDILAVTMILLIVFNSLFLVIGVVFLKQLSFLIFDTGQYDRLYILILILGPIYSVSTYFEVLTQAKSLFTQLVKGRYIWSLVGITTLIPLLHFTGLAGLILSLILAYLFSGLFFLFVNKDEIYAFFNINWPKLKAIILQVSELGAVDIFRKLFVYSSIFIYRIIIVKLLGLSSAGLFQAIWSISLYPEIIFGAIISYYYPLVSSISEKEINGQLKTNFLKYNQIIFPVLAGIILFAQYFLMFLFTKDFTGMASNLKLLIGFKYLDGLYFLMSITLLGQTKLKFFLVADMIKYSILLGLSYLFIPIYQVDGAVLALIISQVVGVVVLVVFFYRLKYLPFSKKLYLNIFSVIGLLTLIHLASIAPFVIRIVVTGFVIITAYYQLEYKTYLEKLIR